MPEKVSVQAEKIRTLGDRVLRQPAFQITRIDAESRDLVGRMIKSMYEAKGIGLAAPQIGVSKQVLVIDTSSGTDMNKLIVLMNPVIIEMRGQELVEEGCLSLPGFRAKIQRRLQVLVEGINLEGKTYKLEAEGLLAQALQHEIDHLRGVLFIDHLPFFKKVKYWKSLREIKKGTKRNR